MIVAQKRRKLTGLQTLQNHGSGSDTVAERGQGVSGQSSRYDFPIGILREATDLFAAMTASQMRIAETIDAFYGDAGTKDGVSRSYKQAVEDLDAETIKALDGPFR